MNDALHDSIRPIRFENGVLHLLDQRRLPDEECWNAYRDAAGVADAIRDMVVRGAPAIGITAAFGVALAARSDATDAAQIDNAIARLRASRPTAVNLFWALDRCAACIGAQRDKSEQGGESLASALTELAHSMLEQDVADNRRMGAFGAELIAPGGAVLTHCNTGSLATGGFGTALGVIRSAWADGRIERVYADETRPWLQGARLTAWELVRDGIPVELICEGAAASLLRSGAVNAVIVGADRIAANGDTANKVGTYMLALAARAHGVPFLVAAPTATIDPATADGDAIVIEQRAADEVLTLAGRRIAAAGAGAWNPAFDVTPAHLIDAVVTERGVIRNPDAVSIATLLGEPA